MTTLAAPALPRGASRSPFGRVLGPVAGELPPVFRSQFLDGAVVLEGTMDVVWHRPRWLRPLLSLLARHDLLFPDTGRDIEAKLEIVPHGDGHAWRRRFAFPCERRFDAVLADDPSRGIVERIGRLEIFWDVRFEAPGRLSIRTRGGGFHLGRKVLPLPSRVLPDVTALEVAITADTIWVSVQASLPFIGSFFGYSGTFAVGTTYGPA